MGVVESTSSKIKSAHLQDAMNDQMATTAKFRIKPVSHSIDVPESAAYDPIRRALAAIDAAHDDGRLPRTTIKLMQKNDVHGEYEPSLNRILIGLGHGPLDTMLHEVGHLLDLHAFGHGQMYESKNVAGRLTRVVSKAMASRAADEWRAIPTADIRDYILDPPEIWARAYAQWVVSRTSRNATFIEAGHWTAKDFEPITTEIDRAFSLEGWL
jgi:hypothetical protein